MNWQQKFVPDAESCVALFTMGLPQKETTFVWVDNGILKNTGFSNYNLMRRVELDKDKTNGVFAAYTAEEFQTILPINFVPMRMADGTWIIVDLHGTTAKHEKIQNKNNTLKIKEQVAVNLARVNGSTANRAAQAWANAAIFLIQTGALKGN